MNIKSYNSRKGKRLSYFKMNLLYRFVKISNEMYASLFPYSLLCYLIFVIDINIFLITCCTIFIIKHEVKIIYLIIKLYDGKGETKSLERSKLRTEIRYQIKMNQKGQYLWRVFVSHVTFRLS